jgi:hypothetical protein
MGGVLSYGRAGPPDPIPTPKPYDRYPQMADPELTDRIMSQGRALVHAIEPLGTIEPTGPTERVLARLLLAGYKRRLRAIIQHPVRKRPARWRLIRRLVRRPDIHRC